MNAHFSTKIKINGFQADHKYLEAQMSECFVLKPKDILGPPFLNTCLLIYLRMNMKQTDWLLANLD